MLRRRYPNRIPWRAVAFVLVLSPAALVWAADSNEPPRQAVTGPRPNPVPTPTANEIQESIDRGIRFLVDSQNHDGSWGSARRTKGLNIYAPVPGAHHAFRAAVTSLCISSLIETGPLEGAAADALQRGQAWLLENLSHVRRATPEAIYNTWAHAYSIQALVRMHRLCEDEDDARRNEIRELLDLQLDLLGRYECVDGGWCYYDFEAHTKRPSGSSISFVTATVLVALDEARGIGVDAPEEMITRAKASLLRQRKPDYTYCYGEYLKYRPMRGINRPGGSVGRSQSCNLAMRHWGDDTVTDEVLVTWLDRLFARNLWLDIGRKRPVPHESWFQVAGYFFYYGHYYAALCIDELEPSQRGRHQDQLAQVLLHLQEKDGSWWDYPFYNYHQPYGTAYALMSLSRCQRRQVSE